MKNKILVTGANGFIGSQLKSFYKGNDKFNFFWHNGHIDGSLGDNSIVRTLPKCDYILHLAAKTFVPESYNSPLEFYRDNILSTLYLLEKARKDNSKFIFFSSYIYGSPLELPISEGHPANPLNPYSTSKFICENMCNSYFRDFGVPSIIFRPFNIYGPGQRDNFLIPLILSQINNEVILLENPRPKRDFIYVDDVVNAINCVLERSFSGCEIYNLGSGKSYSVSEVADFVQKVIKRKLNIQYKYLTRENEIQNTIANIFKFSNEFGWVPTIDIEEGISRIF